MNDEFEIILMECERRWSPAEMVEFLNMTLQDILEGRMESMIIENIEEIKEELGIDYEYEE